MLEFSGIVLFACLLKTHPFEWLEVPNIKTAPPSAT